MLEKRPPPPFWFRVLIPILAVLLAFALCAVLIIIAGANPFTAYYQIMVGALGSRLSRIETFVKVAPLILTGIAVAARDTSHAGIRPAPARSLSPAELEVERAQLELLVRVGFPLHVLLQPV